MRLDLFLKASRLVLRRSAAQELCDAGAAHINGHPAKSARSVAVGDEIQLRYRERTLTVRIIALPAIRQTSKAEASTLYQVTSDTFVSH